MPSMNTIYIIIAIAIASFAAGWKVCEWHHSSKEVKEIRKEVAATEKAQVKVDKIDSLSENERANYEGKIRNLQGEVQQARKTALANHTPDCVVPTVLVHAINQTANDNSR